MPDYNINLTIQNIWYVFRIVLDIGIMWFIIYYAILFVRNNNRTIQIFKGIIFVLIFNGIARLLGLSTLEYFSNTVISWGFLAVIIIFQPEIRGALEKIGKTNAFSKITTLLANEKEDLVNQIYEATIVLSSQKIGALISIEQSSSLQDYIKTGIAVNATVSKELLCSIFMTTTPLHDGAVIIQGDKIACASAYFPPTSINLSSRYGARHRAGLGISEVSDALTIVVSEETSAISIAMNGRIYTVNEKQLKEYLRKVICNEEIEIGDSSVSRRKLKIEDNPEFIIDNETNDMKVPFNNRFKLNKKAKQKTTDFTVESVDVKQGNDEIKESEDNK